MLISTDILVVGAGIIGTFISRELSKYEIDVLVVEKNIDVGGETTSANSGIIHAGFSDSVSTQKGYLGVKGNKMYDLLCQELGVKMQRIGSLVVAFSSEEEKILHKLIIQGKKNKVEVEILTKNDLQKLEPKISSSIISSLFAPSSAIISPYEITFALYENANLNGVNFLLGEEVKSIEHYSPHFLAKTNKTKIKTKYIINCAGLFSDDVSKMANFDYFKITPVKGEYLLFDKELKSYASHTIFHTPTPLGKGILVSPTKDGNLLIGPNTSTVLTKYNKSTTKEGLLEVINGAKKIIPSLDMRYVITSFAGLRAKAQDDFIIEAFDNGFINVAGIQSPGLTAAPAVAEYVVSLFEKKYGKLNTKNNFISKRNKIKKFSELSFGEREKLILKDNDWGEVVCRCETVTLKEVKEAIKRGARTLDGVKFRVRCGMGRCQGGFCTPRVINVLSKELNISPENITKFGRNSKILCKRF